MTKQQADGVSEMIRRLRAPAYWMSGSTEGHEGENDAPREAADMLEALDPVLADTLTENERLRGENHRLALDLLETQTRLQRGPGRCW